MADKGGYIGRSPGDSAVIIARQNYSPTGIQTDFTFNSGYTPGYVDVYLNGVRLIDVQDYTASTGNSVGLTSYANNGDIVEVIAYKAFNVGNVSDATSNFTVGGNLVVSGDTNVSGGSTLKDLHVTGVSTLTGASYLADVTEFVSSGIVTVSNTTDSTSTTTGALLVNGGVGVALSMHVGGNLSVGGTLTYEDVTNVDAIGFGTFRKGLNVQGTGSTTTTLNVTGFSTFTGAIDANSSLDLAGALDVHGHSEIDDINVSGASTFAGAATLNGNTTFGADVTFGGASSATALVWDKSVDDLIFQDDTKAIFGAGSDLSVYHDGSSTSYINNTSSYLRIRSSEVRLSNTSNSTYFSGVSGGAAKVYFNDVVKIETTNDGTVTTGIGTFTTNVAIDATFSEASTDGNDLVIGSTSDTAKGLSIVGSTSGGIGNIFFSDGASYKNQGLIQYRHADDSMRISTNQSERVRITSAGLVGIGTTAAGASSNAMLSVHTSASSACRFNLTNTGSTTAESTQIWSQNNDLAFTAGGSERLRINSDGQAVFKGETTAAQGSVAIEAQDPAIRLYDTNGTSNVRKWEMRNVGATGYLQFRMINDANDTFTERFHIASDGHVAIGGYGAPETILDVRENNDGAETQIRLFNTDNGDTTTQTAAIYMSPDSRGTAATGMRAIKENTSFATNAGRDVTLTLNVLQNNSQLEALRITSARRVLIGAGAVAATTNLVAQGGLQVSANGASGAPSLCLGADGTSANTQTITDNTAKDARIGFPNYDIDEEPLTLINGFVGDGSAIDGNSGARIYIGGGTSYLNAVNSIRFFTTAGNQNTATGDERLRIQSNGRILIAKGTADTTTSQVQIGDSASGYTWDVGDTPQVLIAGVNNESPTSGTLNIPLRVADENSNTMFQIHNRGGGNSDIGQVYVPGNLGAGTDNPAYKLDAAASGTVVSRFRQNTNDEAATAACTIYRHAAATGGNTGFVVIFQNSSGTAVGSIKSNASATAFNTSSDYRLKENVAAISDGITRLKTLKPCRFNFKADASTIVDGFLAHEVTAVPEAIAGTKDEVDSDNNPVYQGIDLSKLVPLLTAALQELITKVETLEAEVAALKSS